MRHIHLTVLLTLATCLAMPGDLWAARNLKISNPDFTKGDAIPEGANHDWNLGATGTRGWIYSDQMSTSDARQVYITKVEKGSPADGVLKVGDVILGVGGKKFAYDPRTEFGKALTIAESEAGGGKLSLIRWRKGSTETVTLELPVLGTYGATAPYDCPKSKRILELGCQALAKRMAEPNYRQNPITRSLNALALLSSGNKEYRPLLKKEAEWAASYSADSFQTWWYGYVISYLAEYVMQTGDDSVMPGLKRLTLEAANGQSIVGSWGHRFAGADGRLVGYGMMNAPGLTLTTSLILARKAGVEDPQLDLAIERSERMLRFYVGKGSVPYGDHSPWIQTHDDNGKNGMAAVMFNLLGDSQAAEYYSRMSLASHGNERDFGHTGNFCNMTWAIPGVAQSGPNATGAWMNEFGAWYFDLARRWDGAFVHQGGEPMTRNDKYASWDTTGAYLLAYAMPLKTLYLTGKQSSNIPQLDMPTAEQIVEDGQGWTRKDRTGYYDKMTTEQLFDRLSSWSPVVRERAGSAIGRRKEDSTGRLLDLLSSRDIHTRYGACQALKFQKERGSAAVPELLKTLEADDLWLRILAAQALGGIGDQSAVPVLLQRIAQGPTADDPRNMEQRYLTFVMFNRGGMLSKSMETVDRDLLYRAVRAGLQNEDGRARGSFTSVYNNLSFEEIQPLLPAIHRAVVEPAPSGIMFADGIRMQGLRLLAKYRVKEGMDAAMSWLDFQNHWHSPPRTIELMEVLQTYGAHSKALVPELEALAVRYNKGENILRRDQGIQLAKTIREGIKAIEASTDTPELITLEN